MATLSTQSINNKLREMLDSEQFQAWSDRLLAAPINQPAPVLADASVKTRRQLEWRAWVSRTLYAVCDLFDQDALKALALLDTNPPLEVGLLFHLCCHCC